MAEVDENEEVPGGTLEFRHQRLAPLDSVAERWIRQHTSAYVSIRQHTSAYVSIRQLLNSDINALHRSILSPNAG